MEGVIGASAALLFNELEALAGLPDGERYDRLCSFLETCLAAAGEFRERRLEPSNN